MIHWTRQIKDVVNNHDNALSAEILGPLEEIEVQLGVFVWLKLFAEGTVFRESCYLFQLPFP